MGEPAREERGRPLFEATVAQGTLNLLKANNGPPSRILDELDDS